MNKTTPKSSEHKSAESLQFLDLNSGSSHAAPRSKVNFFALNALDPIIDAGEGRLGAWSVRLIDQDRQGAKRFELSRDGLNFATCVVAWEEETAAEMWSAMAYRQALPALDKLLGCPPLPWLVSLQDETSSATLRERWGSSLYEPMMREFTGLAETIAWAILLKGQAGRASAPGGVSEPDVSGVGFPDFPLLPTDGATLCVGPCGLMTLIRLSGIRPPEVSAINDGEIEVGILTSGKSGIMLARFQNPGTRRGELIFDMPFHIGLLDPGERYLTRRGHSERRNMLIVVMDEAGRPLGEREVTLSQETSEVLERIVESQARVSGEAGWSRRQHDREVDDFYKRFPDPTRIVDRLFERAHVRQTIH
ncbi:hypothetical protein [Aureimonas glaciei]|nr:hypothetical protein [Aureimonas glaciei]